jgi:type III pantothenate kinase
MTVAFDHDLLAIDLGSSCIKLGWFRTVGACATEPPKTALAIGPPKLPAPDEATRVEHRGRDAAAWSAEIDHWLDQFPVAASSWCLIGSVQPRIAESLIARLRGRPWDRLRALSSADLPLTIRTAEPARVGIDRVLDTVAVNRLRQPDAPAIVVDMGTAITVDLVAADGAFEGGAIFAGPVLSLSALHGGTASLPSLDLSGLESPPNSVGKSTEEALVAGAYWGAAGAVRELVRRTAEQLPHEAELYLTGGGAPGYAAALDLNGRRPRHLPHLVLSGIRIVAQELARR